MTTEQQIGVSPHRVGGSERVPGSQESLADITFESQFGGLPGTHTFSLSYSNIEATSLAQDDIGRPPGLGGELAIASDSWSISYMGEQFLSQHPTDPTRGWGTFLFVGFSDGDPNPIQFTSAAGIMGKGVSAARPCDTFGLGVFYNDITDDLKETFESGLPPLLQIGIQDELGAEIFYDFAVTDWFRIGADFQVAKPVLRDRGTAYFGGFRSRIIF